jgi:hypothetical protein
MSALSGMAIDLHCSCVVSDGIAVYAQLRAMYTEDVLGLNAPRAADFTPLRFRISLGGGRIETKN